MSDNRKPLIQAIDVQKNFGNLSVLRGIDLNIYKGDVVVIIGPSGSGKSTFLRCLNLLETPDSGEIYIDGIDIRNIDPMWLRTNIGIVLQEPVLFKGTIF